MKGGPRRDRIRPEHSAAWCDETSLSLTRERVRERETTETGRVYAVAKCRVIYDPAGCAEARRASVSGADGKTENEKTPVRFANDY